MSFESGTNFLPDPNSLNQEVLDATPKDCLGCPAQCELGGQLGELILSKHLMNFAANHLVGEEGAQFDAQIDANLPPELAVEMKTLLRKQAAEDMDDVDEQINTTKSRMLTNADRCSKPLKMRASKAGATYTVSVCTSPEVYNDSKDEHAPTHTSVTKNE